MRAWLKRLLKFKVQDLDGELLTLPAAFCTVYYIFVCPHLKAVTLHTDLGDIKIELYCDKVPKACEVAIFILGTKIGGMIFWWGHF